MASIYQCELNLKRNFMREKKTKNNGPFCSACMCLPRCRAPTQLRARPQPSFQTCVTDPTKGNISGEVHIHKVNQMTQSGMALWSKNHLDALVDVSHPLLLLCCSCSKHCKGLAPANSIFWIKAATAKHKDPILKMLPNT